MLWRTELSQRPAYQVACLLDVLHLPSTASASPWMSSCMVNRTSPPPLVAATQAFIMGRGVAEKRLVAMADRYTNTLHTTDLRAYARPTAVSCFAGNLSSVTQWWVAWRTFMFRTRLEVALSGATGGAAAGGAAVGGGVGGGAAGGAVAAAAARSGTPPAARLRVMRSSRYPKISAFEEAISVPLQALSLAVYDASLVHLLNAVAPDWQQAQAQVRGLATTLLQYTNILALISLQ